MNFNGFVLGNSSIEQKLTLIERQSQQIASDLRELSNMIKPQKSDTDGLHGYELSVPNCTSGELLWLDKNKRKLFTQPVSDLNFEDWHYVGDTGEPAFGTYWSNWNALIDRPLRFRKEAGDIVRVEGMLRCSATATGNQTVFNLPSGYRPSRNSNFMSGQLVGSLGSSPPYSSSRDCIGRIDKNTGAVDIYKAYQSTGTSYWFVVNFTFVAD